MSALEEQRKDVILEKGKLVVKKFETSDKDIVSYFEDIKPESRKEKFESVVKTGVIALRTVGIAERIDYIQKEFSNLSNEFSGNLDDTVDQLDKKFEEIFGEKGKFGDVVKQYFGEDGKIVKELFDPGREGSPLNTLRNEMRNEISGLKTLLQLEEQKMRSSRKLH